MKSPSLPALETLEFDESAIWGFPVRESSCSSEERPGESPEGEERKSMNSGRENAGSTSELWSWWWWRMEGGD
jgi:hypothetical protein